MKKTDLHETKDLDVKALKQKGIDLKKELSQLILDKNMNKLNDLKVLNKKRKDLAQVLTIMNQKLTLIKLEEGLKEVVKN